MEAHPASAKTTKSMASCVPKCISSLPRPMPWPCSKPGTGAFWIDGREEDIDAANQAYRADAKRARKGRPLLQGRFWNAGDPACPEWGRVFDRRLHQPGDPELEDGEICRCRRQRPQL